MPEENNKDRGKNRPRAARRRQRGRRQEDQDTTFAAGPGGNCICTQCGYKQPHIAGQPCNRQSCPQCGAQMIRE